ncbi:RsmB/NOP family class I SAM-dependent RNA methyltransferase [Vannielia litorea]|uniref:RsmB/NOP family class I SAM-dependent RNA methyltransferase n=1 Tax=Vannielia litorea TaxID=1217970 RepID=UPI001C967828|nr:transcription antitermination factor NusB [Vannielia litorea]MBY6049208.1 methyltransferase domain-containing protein [Vannielia litorea]MBY6076622.1 methyltransferase domain-containing protein [Vannielia litorea]
MADAARELALSFIKGVLAQRIMMSELVAATQAPPEVMARAQRLANATLRNLGPADAALKPYIKKAPPAPVRDVLRLATVELLALGEAAHGVVSEAVSLTREVSPRAAGMANAVLRRVAEEGQAAFDAAPPTRMANWLRGRLGAAYGNAVVAQIEAAHGSGAPLDLSAKGDPAALAEAVGGTLLPGGSVRITGPAQVSALPGFEEGAFWVQDAAAAMPAKLLAPQPGERVLDLCAAPGGKTMQLAAAGAEVTALDLSEWRLKRVDENLARTGLSANLVAADALTWTPEEAFDAILLDAPCSATGTIRRHPDLPHVKDGKGLKELFALQAQMLERAMGWLKPGGRLVYCVCSLLPEEGEKQVEGHELIRPEAEWIEESWRAGNGLRLRPDFWPDRGGMDGFYMAVLRKP